MTRLITLMWIFARQSFLEQMAWRSFLVTIVLEKAVTPLVGLAVWRVALPDSDAISRYYVAVLVVQLLTVSYEHHTLANRVYDGTLTHELVKPIPAVTVFAGGALADRLWHLLIGLPLIAVLWWGSGGLDWRDLAIAVPAIVLAMMMRFLMTWSLALTACWSQQAHGAVGFGETLLFLLGGIAVPLALMPDALEPVARALPFAAMLGFPAEMASGGLDGDEIVIGYLLQVAWLGVFAWLAGAMWRAGLPRFAAVGG
jgi:ABC-2 type transport system permease protein